MDTSNNHDNTLLDLFLSIARNSETIEDFVLECGTERWTFGDLDAISTGLAIQLNERFGLRPTVAVISENHPYVLAILLATWKLDGIFAPMDHHAPMNMIRKMLETVEATCVVAPEGNQGLMDLLQVMNKKTIFFSQSTTVISLTQRYLELDPSVFPLASTKPTMTSVATYLHTSSASSVSNLKLVQLTHGAISSGSQLTVDQFRKAWPLVSFEKPRVLVFSPWSHIMAISHDIGACGFGLGGTIVIGVLPSGYPCDSDDDNDNQTHPNSIFGKAEQEMDVLDRLLETALRTQPDIFVGVPWVLEGFKERYQRLLHMKKEDEVARVEAVLQNFKCFGVGGAAMTDSLLSWAGSLKINLSSNIGMTEFGGPLFHRRIDHISGDNEGWSKDDCIVRGAEFTLVNDTGEEDTHEGELFVRSRYISHGYLKYDNSVFTKAVDGTITFRTGDIYFINEGGRYVWKGRRDDYIQMVSSETLDPRPIERALNLCSGVAHCCVVGNNFIGRPSQVVCAIIQPSSPKLSSKEVAEITQTVASVNRTLLPPLRIAWSRVGILDYGTKIPYTKKGTIFRKKLEEQFGDFLGGLLRNSLGKVNGTSNHESIEESAKSIDESSLLSHSTIQANKNVSDVKTNLKAERWSKQEVENSLMKIIADVLEVGINVLRTNPEASFSELGMDSNMAVRIVNELNKLFGLQFPLNACHDFIDTRKLSEATLIALGIREDLTKKATQKSSTSRSEEDVVIVGQALRLPGDINTPQSFWDALISKRDDIMIPVPADRWDHSSFYRSPTSTSPLKSGDINFEKSGFVDVAHFDNNFFGISTPEALCIAPSTRLTLETVFDALEDACIPISKLKGTNTGVFVGASLNEGYPQMLFEEKGFDVYTRFYGTGIAASTICGRISYLLDIHGPSAIIDTACSSGLVVLDQAVKYIQSGEGELAIVSAVNTNLWPGSFGFLSAQKMVSPNSRCAAFTNEADGYVPSEASVSFILKSKSAAIRDGNNILAVIKSTGVMHGGKTQGLVAPNVSTQISLQRSLLLKAELEPSQIDFLEAHGTGTQLGDLIEIQGINRVFERSHSKSPLILGAAKSCIGHTEVAAGLVGLLKAIGTLKHTTVPGLVHLTTDNMNPSIDCGIVPITIPIDATLLPPKERKDDPYRGLVLANGFAGTFAGVIIEEAQLPYNKLVSSAADRILMPFVISAKTASALEDYLEKYLHFCKNAEACDFQNICYTACVGREHYRYRFACVASDMEELVSWLQEGLRTFSHRKIGSGISNRVAFAFPGQGSQYQGMASQLAERYSDFKDILVLHASTAAHRSGFPVLSFLMDKTPSGPLNIDDSQVSQICIFVYQYCISLWLAALGLEPCAVLGHSLGEIAASVIAGAMSFEEALAFVIKRAELLRADPVQPGGMAIISASEQTILRLISELGLNGQVVIAVYNDPQSHVLSGKLSAVETLLSVVKNQGLRATKLSVTQGFHSPLIHSRLPALQTWLAENQVSLSPLRIPLYSTLYGSEISSDSCLTATYWVEHARDPVRLWNAVTALSGNKGIDAILDVGPQPFIWAATQSMSISKSFIPLSSKRTGDQAKAFLTAIVTLFENGVNLNFERLFSKGFGKFVQLPTYPYQRQRHYPNVVPSRNASKIASSLTPLTRDKPVRQLVMFNVDEALYELLADHQIEDQRVAPGASLVDFFASKADSRSVKSIIFHAPLVIESPHLEVSGEIDASGRFFLQGGSSKNQVCSGVLSSRPPHPPTMHKDERPPECIQSQAEIYESIKGVHFGPSFRNIQNIRSWPTHADVLITVKSTQHPTLDRIRKIDCCLHALGGLVHREVPQVQDLNGSFLPTSLDDFTLHGDHLPESFICRYNLPFDVARNYHVVSVSFAVFSLSGELLISCRKYSVAWIPAGVALQNAAPKIVEPLAQPRQWLRQVWAATDRDTNTPDATPAIDDPYEHLMLISPYATSSPLLPLLKNSNLTVKTISFSLPDDILDTQLPNHKDTQTLQLDAQIETTIQSLNGSRTIIVLDLTSIDSSPINETSLHLYRPVLHIMKLLARRKIDIANFVVVSEMSIPAQIDGSSVDEPPVPMIGALVQGMFRVFRREMGIDCQLWALDLPRLDTLDDSTISTLLVTEINGRRKRPQGLDRTVAYRKNGSSGELERLVPVLREVVSVDVMPKLTGPSVIIGMGSIGVALVESLLSNGSSCVVFIGRRPCETSEVSDVIARLNLQFEDRVSYFQADVCDFESLRKCFVDIQKHHGDIETVIHTAAVISDAILWNIDFENFERVLRPKVIGAWNLHLITEELCPALKSFVLLSSISVSLGNQGQMAYVGGNSYMEVLSSYRLARNLPATAIQLGPWESKLTQELSVSNTLVSIMPNKIGIPLILNAIARHDAVQVITSFNIDAMATTPAYAQDPLFAEFLPSESTQISQKQRFTETEISNALQNILRTVLELKSTESLEPSESLIGCGIDSIAFAQIRGRAMKELGVEVPMMFLSDSLTIREMIAYVVDAIHTVPST